MTSGWGEGEAPVRGLSALKWTVTVGVHVAIFLALTDIVPCLLCALAVSKRRHDYDREDEQEDPGKQIELAVYSLGNRVHCACDMH